MKDKFTSKLHTWNLTSQKVLIRCVLNVPTNDGKILQDHRVKASLPTIDLILKKQGLPILITHIGRPTHHDPNLSTYILVPWFKEHGYSVQFVESLEQLSTINHQPNSIVIFENLRFFKGEQQQDSSFAQMLARSADFFVQDAFATLHRSDASMTLVPSYFDTDHKTLGLCCEREFSMLEPLHTNPKRPYVTILGGGKVHDKLPLLEHMIDHADVIMICPAIVFTFLYALEKPVGKSLIDTKSVDTCLKLITKAQQKSVPLLFPVDYQVAHQTINGVLSTTTHDELNADDVGISIGPKTVAEWKPYIQQAQSIFYNSGMGFLSRPETLEGAHQILSLIAESQSYSVVGGGESVGIVKKFNLADHLSFVSTGGGATLAYLADASLPGLNAIID